MNPLQPAIKAELFEAILNRSQVAAVVTDLQQPDHPIVYANKRFEELTGYSNEEIIGKNCRFLQGDKTDDQAIAQMKKALRIYKKQRSCCRTIERVASLFGIASQLNRW